jgi:hypothetical protein
VRDCSATEPHLGGELLGEQSGLRTTENWIELKITATTIPAITVLVPARVKKAMTPTKQPSSASTARRRSA